MGKGFSAISAVDHLGRIARKYPDKLAISDGDLRLTYRALTEAVTRLALLIAAAVPAGQSVGLLLGNCGWYPVAMLAGMAAGRVSVPLNPRDPPRRILDIARDAGLPAIIGLGADGFAAWPERPDLRWIDVAGALHAGDPQPAATLPDAVSVDAPAVVLYTSGSTGRPKGIVNSQRSLLQRVQQYVDAAHINSEDVFLPLSGAATIAGCREVLTALLVGATLHLADVEAVGLRAIRRQFRSCGVTIVYLVPALLRALMTASDDDDFGSLRVVRIGGEKILWTDIALVRKVVSRSCFIQISYSSTETTGSHWFVPVDYPELAACVPAGYLLPGISFAVVDDDGAPVRSGQSGELLIKSMHVTLGYWENGQIVPMTTDRDDPRQRVFSTGDLVQLDERGLLQIVGRKDRQIKINGRRVEPAELEIVLRRARQARDAVAVVTAASELVAFVVPEETAGPDLGPALRDIVRRALPPSLHPTRLHLVAEIPRLAGGKVDTARLRDLDQAMRGTAEPAERADAGTPLNLEQAVEVTWKRILGRADVAGRWDEAGGDSLKLLQCVMEIETLLGRELDLEAFTTDMTAADMIAAVADGQDASPGADRQTGAPPVLFMLPGSVGYGPSLAAFGAGMGRVARVTPIRYPDLVAILDGRGTIAAMTEAALRQINLAQPRGDVRLLGYSLGGAVAFEVAARLLAAGRPVKFLGILDTNVGGAAHHLREAVARTVQRIGAHRVSVYRTACRSVAKAAARLGWERHLAGLLEREWLKHLPDTRFLLRLELEEVLRMRAMGDWLALSKSCLPIKGTLFRCNRPGVPFDLGWGRLFADVDVIAIAGGHLDLVVEPHLAVNRPLVEGAVAATYA
ncbi:non-ribosomal peptide synthetase [Phreatobacter stygius]|uniref:AMP-dependent synthetase n=1 Tax=Phreatobacter stygius TaxID=1940610 RepID=A0A4D7BC87_9HYPH|nr:AMP-binding protein [Phreatobacter stygius]QCI68410.1 AMP-dependent synthetase [Phreatobacter stygius]